VHTPGFGSGRSGCGLGRIAEVFGGVAEIQGLECSSSPTSGTYFPCSGAFGPLSVHKLFTYGPIRGPLFVGRCCGGWLLPWVGQWCCCVLLHGRERVELHDMLLIGISSSWPSLLAAGTGLSARAACAGRSSASGTGVKSVQRRSRALLILRAPLNLFPI
jgi:hypothetical protein